MSRRTAVLPLAPVVLACAAAVVGPAFGQSAADQLPPQLDGVGVVERLGEALPLELILTDETGAEVALGDFFRAGRPVIVTPVYYRCPMLCNLTLNGLVDGLNDVDWTAGEEFEIVTFSFNPLEDAKIADVKKRAYLTQYDRAAAAEGWHFLTGDFESIDALCRALGFGYRLDEKTGDYAHTSTIVFCTPDGRISRYINDVLFKPRDLRYALIESAEGSIGSSMDKLILFMCYQYDPEANSYVASAWKIMRLGGVVTLIVLATGLTLLFLRGSTKQALLAASSAALDVQP